jgi:hypothetical protein
VKEFVEKSYPVVFIARYEIFAESYRGGINCARLAYLPEVKLINDHQAANSLQFAVLCDQGDAKYKSRTGKQFPSDGTGEEPTIGVKGTNVWFPISNRYAVRPFPAIQNVTGRSDWAERQVIRFVESMLGTVARATSIGALIAEVADARKSVSSGNFGCFTVVIAVGEFPASLSS